MTEVKHDVFSPFNILRVSIGIIYFWFGVLKFFFGFSPAEQIAGQTIHQLTFGLMPDRLAVLILAVWECALGLLLIGKLYMKPVLVMLFVHMACTFTPFLFFPQQTFMRMPYDFTLLGQYIMKNIIIISGAMVLWQHDVKLLPTYYVKPYSEQQV